MRGKGEKRFRQTLLMLTTAFSLLLTACGTVSDYEYTDTGSADVQIREYESVADVPEYSGEPYVEINENQPEFTEEEITTEAFEAVPSSAALSMYESIFLAAALLMTCLSSGSACQSTLP